MNKYVKPSFYKRRKHNRKHKIFIHRENGLDAGISASSNTSTRIKIFRFSCACAYACVWAATSENEIPLRHNTSIRILTTSSCVWPMKTLDHLAVKQFSKLAEGSDDFSCACVCLEFRYNNNNNNKAFIYKGG